MAAQSPFAQFILRADYSSLQLNPSFSLDGPPKHPLIVAFNSSLIATHFDPQASHMRGNSNILFLISSVPALVAFCVLLFRAFEYIPLRPKWLRRFVDERTDGPKVPNDDGVQGLKPNQVIWLLVSTVLGLLTQIILIFVSVRDLTALPRVLTWVSRGKQLMPDIADDQTQAVTVLLLTVDRPRTAPITVLVNSSSLLLSQLVLCFSDPVVRPIISVLRGCEILAAVALIVLILSMPLRDPELAQDGISPPFEKPINRLRSPEDNLTLWQFMSVSWMSPLMSIGSKRQLNSEDVWSLGFEFQHRLLHEKFRELEGSVIRRLLSANGVDLLILSALGIVEAVSSMYSAKHL